MIDRLQRRCIYYELFYKDEYIREAYKYVDCKGARYKRCDIRVYRQWRKGIDMERSGNCWECGLSQKICRRMEGKGACEYPNVMLVGIFILNEQGVLEEIAKQVGFRGKCSKDMWKWMNEEREGWGSVWESNWMVTWRQVCKEYKAYVESCD